MRRIPRPSLSLRRAMVLAAGLAAAIAAYRVFRDGLPPRSVVRAIPARIERLRPGMSREEARDVLGIGRPWYRGGTGAESRTCEGNGRSMHVTYYIRPLRRLTVSGTAADGSPVETDVSTSTASIQLLLSTRVDGFADWRHDPETRLTGATFSGDLKNLAEMPGSRPCGTSHTRHPMACAIRAILCGPMPNAPPSGPVTRSLTRTIYALSRKWTRDGWTSRYANCSRRPMPPPVGRRRGHRLPIRRREGHSSGDEVRPRRFESRNASTGGAS